MEHNSIIVAYMVNPCVLISGASLILAPVTEESNEVPYSQTGCLFGRAKYLFTTVSSFQSMLNMGLHWTSITYM